MDVINKRSIKKVYWNNQFGFDEQRRDSAVKDVLDRNNIYNESFDDQVVYPPGTIRTMEGKPYSVFTPFKRRWIENFNMDFLDIEFKYTVKKESNIKSNLNNISFEKDHSVDMSIWPAGEETALLKLTDYLDSKVIRYAKDRNDPILEGTSRISPYLASESFHLGDVY